MPSSTSDAGGGGRRGSRSSQHQRSSSTPKIEVRINVYDLLPPGRLSSFLWTVGGGLLHSGVVLNGREYAYGGHARRGVTGVYWTRPRFEPPGGTFRIEVLHGFTFQTVQELEGVIKEISHEFMGRDYNLLTNNCNHFTSALCERLTGRAAPAWLNRAASIGVALPCVVPREWIDPPDHETAEGELLRSDEEEEEDDDDDEDDENAGMLTRDHRREHLLQRNSSYRESRDDGKGRRGSGSGQSIAGGPRIQPKPNPPPARVVSLTDSAGRELPVAERAPLPRKMSTSPQR